MRLIGNSTACCPFVVASGNCEKSMINMWDFGFTWRELRRFLASVM